MEIFNSRRWMGLSLILPISISALLLGCSSENDSFLQDKDEMAKSSNVIRLDNGEVIVLSDTTICTLDANNANIILKSVKASEDLFGSATRASAGKREYGFDTETPNTDWKKYLLSDFQSYGIPKGIYVGRNITIHKDLPIEIGTYAVPADYTSAKAPSNSMGWIGSTKTIGFTPTTKSDNIADGATRVFFIKCDLSGRTYNKYVPADPANFVWAYKCESSEDIW